MHVTQTFGITNITSREQAAKAVAVFKALKGAVTERKLRLGVVSNGAIIVGVDSQVLPSREQLAAIFPAADEVCNCLRFSWTLEDGDPAKLISQAIEWAWTNIDAIEIDMDWPDPGVVAEGIHRSRKNLEVTLRLGGRAIEMTGNNPEEVVGRLEEFETFVQRVKFHVSDKPMFQGEGMGLIPYVTAVQKRFPEMGIAVSSHHGASVINHLVPLVKVCPRIGVDACINWESSKYLDTYLRRAFELLG